MKKQRIEVIVGAVVSNDRWLPNQPHIEKALRVWLIKAVQDKISDLQGGKKEGYGDVFVEVEYGDEL